MSLIYHPDTVIRDKYRITGVLGKGGVAITYSAISLETNSPVAIKVISLKQLDDWKQVELFEREAEVLKQLSHPAIPKYIDYFDVETDKDKLFYLVQEIAPGKSLFELVDSGWRATEKEVKDIAQQVLGILAYLHSLDPPVIHRDIKPNNLIRDDEGKIYLVDFGAVKNTYYNTLMQGSTVVGTYGYMSPEQFRGQTLPATDLYGLGATLLYLLTHRSPAELPQDTLKLDFRSAVNIDDSFAEWLEKILEPNIEDRFNNTEIALGELNQGKLKQQRKLITTIAAVVLALGCILGVNSYKWFFLSYLGFVPADLCQTDTWNQFIEAGGNINRVNIKSIQPINSMLSCTLAKSLENKDFVLAQFLVDNGADIEVKNEEGESFLLTAVSNKHDLDLLKFLIKNKANINKQYYRKTTLTPPHFEFSVENIGNTNNQYYREITPIHLAINVNNTEAIKLLIDYGAEINTINSSGVTPFYRAIELGNLDAAKLLLDRGAKIDFGMKSVGNVIYNPIIQGKTDTIKFLIDLGFWQDIKDNLSPDSLFTTVARENIDTIKFLSDRDINLNIKNSSGQTLLHEATTKEMAMLLINNGVPVNTKDNQLGLTPLFEASSLRNIELAQTLIKYGAEVNARNNNGETPLFWAGNKEVAKLLIDNGAEINSKDKEYRTPLYQAVKSHGDEVARLLIDNGADIRARTIGGKTILFEAKSEQIAQLLIDRGIDVKVKTKLGHSALSMAVINNKVEIAKLLIKHGADVNVRYISGMHYDKTPISAAVKNRNLEIVKLLIANGAEINLSESRPPLVVAIINEDKEMMDLLLKHGADRKYLQYRNIEKFVRREIPYKRNEAIDFLIEYNLKNQ